ncbi:MAG: DUF1810 domain-containing protein [Acidobacteriaceae bacterium]
MAMDEMGDKYDLQRFVNAQNPVIEQVRTELGSGRKTGHWMWFIFPQIKGLSLSETSRYFAISSREEAAAYLEHPILGRRLRECTELVSRIGVKSIDQIFDHPDDLKFRSSMTLFAKAAEDDEVFLRALKKYFGGELDASTLTRLG